MFCYKCGYKLNDEAIFCSQCGTKVQRIENDIRTYSRNISEASADLEHEALKIYLKDILAMECIKRKYMSELDNVTRRLSSVSGQYYYKRFEFNNEESWRYPDSSFLHFMYQNGCFYIAVGKTNDHGSLETCPETNSYLNNKNYYINISDNFNFLTNISMWMLATSYEDSYPKKKKNGKKAKEAFLNCYEEFKSSAVESLKTKLVLAAKFEAEKVGITNELEALENILEKGYSVNIIPTQFRKNLYAIYYLYDFISSSNQSLSTALLHFDLNEIKTKLDKIIEQQQNIIIQQSIIMAQNKEKMEYNQKYLKNLVNIEGNTAQAAIYSGIAANNAEACAWIGLANYLKN